VCEGGLDVGVSGTGSASNSRWRPRCYIPIERTLGNRRERGKTEGVMDMRQVNRETCSLYLFSFFKVCEKEMARGRSADFEQEVRCG